MRGEVVRRTPGSVVRRSAGALVMCAALISAIVAPTTPAVATVSHDEAQLYLVTLTGPGVAGYRGALPRPLRTLQLQREQDQLLVAQDLPEPMYRWTSALNGFALRLDAAQADALRATPSVALVEPNSLRTVTSAPGTGTGPLFGSSPGPARGGSGVVIGVIDTGLWPESPLFANTPGLGPLPAEFAGTCETGPGWSSTSCNRKVVAAHWYVDGFGRNHLRTSAMLSARDDSGHGTQMASIAAGNAGVSVSVADQRLGHFDGTAPQARLAIYKACWTAPDPTDDGCATADLVTAIDQATADGVDVLNLSVGGPNDFDTVERALLGAAESDVVVVAAAGNSGDSAFAAHASPWVTTVGGTTGPARRGRVEVLDGPDLDGAMAWTQAVDPAPIVRAATVAAPGHSPSESRLCLPGSLDAAQVAGTVVLCERGRIGRVDKSAAVARADGVAMVLANVGRGSVHADFHSVPTVHLDRDAANALSAWVREHPAARVRLQPTGLDRTATRVTSWSAAGDPMEAILKPDVVAPAEGMLGAVPPSVRSTRWDFADGTSAATAYTSGLAAGLRSRKDWSAAAVRSALSTSASRVGGAVSVLRSGAGVVQRSESRSPGLIFDVAPGDYRSWLEGRLPADGLNTPSVLVSGGESTLTRRVTNVSGRPMYFSSSATGFRRHQVKVTPAALRLAPGSSASFTVSVSGSSRAQPLDDGWVVWRGANGSRVRVPVLITR